MGWSNEAIMEFLDLYEREPSIWNPRNVDHKDRSKIHDAWKRIQSSISFECPLRELKNKKENLMATYRKLALKVKKSSTKTGARAKEVYKPEWFAYEKMASFLHSSYTPRKMITSEKGPEFEQDDPLIIEYAAPDPVDTPNNAYYDEESDDTAASDTAVIYQSGPSRRKSKVEKTGNADKHMDEAEKPKDECSLFCDLLYLKLKALDDDTREIAMHGINNLMFNLKKPKIQQHHWSTHKYEPGYFAQTFPRDRSANPVETAVDGLENSFPSAGSSDG